MQDFQLALKFLPAIMRDQNDPFRVRALGYTVCREKTPSPSFRNLTLDPASYEADAIIEYAVYYDYDIQHMYDLEHIWVAAKEPDTVQACWGSFHGMRFRIDRLQTFHTDGSHAVVYAEPGKHAFLPDPELFYLHDQYPICCNVLSGGGLLIPPFLKEILITDPEQNAIIRNYMRKHFPFEPCGSYESEAISEDQLIPWQTLLTSIPDWISVELNKVKADR